MLLTSTTKRRHCHLFLKKFESFEYDRRKIPIEKIPVIKSQTGGSLKILFADKFPQDGVNQLHELGHE